MPRKRHLLPAVSSAEKTNGGVQFVGRPLQGRALHSQPTLVARPIGGRHFEGIVGHLFIWRQVGPTTGVLGPPRRPTSGLETHPLEADAPVAAPFVCEANQLAHRNEQRGQLARVAHLLMVPFS